MKMKTEQEMNLLPNIIMKIIYPYFNTRALVMIELLKMAPIMMKLEIYKHYLEKILMLF